METNEVKEHIVRIIEKATSIIEAAYNDDTNKTRLCFPKSAPDRVSEQEFRFAFIEAFNDYAKDKGLDWRYAVEVPTIGYYKFSEKHPEIGHKEDGDCRSAMFDLVVYDGENAICLIEFKAGNPEEFCYKKDFLKLLNPNEGNKEVLRYFLQVVKGHNRRTKENVEKKINNAYEYCKDIIKSDIQVVCQTYSLKDKKISIV